MYQDFKLDFSEFNTDLFNIENEVLLSFAYKDEPFINPILFHL